MADHYGRPLLNPILRLTKEPKPKAVSGGGKNASGIKNERLVYQREVLAALFADLAEQASLQPHFSGRVILYASMFDDSLAPTWIPSDLFEGSRSAQIVVPYQTGYLIEVNAHLLASYAKLIEQTELIKDMVDISRIEKVRFFVGEDVLNFQSINDVWEAAPETEKGRAFIISLMPLRDNNAAEDLLKVLSGLRGVVIVSPPPLLESVMKSLGSTSPIIIRQSLRTVAISDDRIDLMLREYRQHRRARMTIIVPSQDAFQQLLASGTIFRIDPVHSINSTSPGEGAEPDRPIPGDLSGFPIVGVVDGGLTAGSYQHAEAWRFTPPLVKDPFADSKHGNRVASLIVQGHDWNNNLALPKLYCQLGIVQAVAKDGTQQFIDPQDFITYLDAVMTANPDTRVWNFSLNQRISCEIGSVSSLGHDLALLARKHNVLPIISVGNKPGAMLQPPADCEAAITVGGRLHNDAGYPGEVCPLSLCGPGPSGMLKPELSNFSKVRAIGGVIINGSSFAAALTSPLAAHTMVRLRDSSPDMVRAILLHHADGDAFDPMLGFGTPEVTTFPWECKPGYVTLQWTASLRPGAAFYWELPIPRSLKKTGKLKGVGVLTAVINPHPMVTDYAGPNYFSVRLATALQYQSGVTKNGIIKFKNLLGSLDTDRITEEESRTIDHKWSPIRHYKKPFHGKAFEGNSLRIYARVYARDLYIYDYSSAAEVPAMDAVFVLSIGTGDENDDVYNELRNHLGAFVETAIVETDFDIENE